MVIYLLDGFLSGGSSTALAANSCIVAWRRHSRQRSMHCRPFRTRPRSSRSGPCPRIDCRSLPVPSAGSPRRPQRHPQASRSDRRWGRQQGRRWDRQQGPTTGTDDGTDDGTDRCPGGAGAGDQLALRSITARTGGSVQNRGRGTTTAQVTASIGTGRGNLLHLAAPAGSPTAPIAPSIDVSILVEIGISVLTTDGHASPFRHWLTVANLLVPGRAARRHAVADPCGARRAGSPVSERASLDAEGQGERREERGERRGEKRETDDTYIQSIAPLRQRSSHWGSTECSARIQSAQRRARARRA